MKPYWQSACGRYTVYHGDCLEILPTLEAGSVDCVCTDPPFGIGFKYASHDDTPEGYGEFLWERISAAEALLAPGSPVFVWQAMPNVRMFAEWFPRKWRLFAACKNFVQIRPGPMVHSFDPVVVWWTEGEAYTGNHTRDWCVADTTPSGREARGERVNGHPCPRPIQHMDYIVSNFVRPGGLIIDPFLGSGTTGVACVKTNRRFIGIEIDERYCEIAARRIQAEANHLFAETGQ